MKNVTIPSQFLKELLALCGPEDHELRERVLKSAAPTHPAEGVPEQAGTYADEHNHWDSLGEDEKIEWAFDCAVCLSVVTTDLMKALKLIANSENSALDLAYCKGIARAAIANALREPMTHHTDAERAKFEAWCDSNEYDRVTRLDGSGYNNEKTKRAWLAWQAARRTPAAAEPQGWKLVPVNLLEHIQESLGSFVSDQGWSQSDIDTADALDGLLARDLIEDTDLDDEAFDDFAEDVDESECHNCSGTGEGMYDSQPCVVCLGKGFL